MFPTEANLVEYKHAELMTCSGLSIWAISFDE